MTVRGLFAIVRAKLMHLARSPVAIVVLAAFLLLASGFAATAAPSRPDQVRQAGAWLVSAASAFLFLSALLIPVSGNAPERRLAESRVTGRVVANLGHAAAGVLFLVFLAGLLALSSWGWLAFSFGNPDPPAGAAVVRSVVYRNPAPIVIAPDRPWSSGAVAFDRHPGMLRVELLPRPRFRERGAPAPATRVSREQPALEISWDAGGESRSRRVPLGGGKVVETIEFAEASRAGGSIAVRLRLLGEGVDVAFDRGDVIVLGVRQALLPVLLRSFLVAGLAASVIAAVTQWFSGFVGPVIAVVAATTLAVVAAAVKVMAPDGGALAGVAALLPPDPVGALRRGHEVGWSEVGRAGLASLGALAAASLAALPGADRGRS